MTDQPTPRNDVLAERIDGLGRRFSGVERRLDGLATKEELIALMQSRDALVNTQITNLSEDIRELAKGLADERAAREKAIESMKADAKSTRTFALGALGLVLSAVVAVVGWVSQIGGPPV